MGTVHAHHPAPVFAYPVAPFYQSGVLAVAEIWAVTAPLTVAVSSVVGSAVIRVLGTTSGQLEFDIEYESGSGWASIFSSLPTIAYGDYVDTFTPNVTSFAIGTRFRAEITEISGGATEEDLAIQLFGIAG